MIILLKDLDIQTICEGVETPDKLLTLRDLRANLIQGYVLEADVRGLVDFDALEGMSAQRIA